VNRPISICAVYLKILPTTYIAELTRVICYSFLDDRESINLYILSFYGND
jgi:hypothetical protein